MISSLLSAFFQFPSVTIPITALTLLVTYIYFHEKKYYSWYKKLPVPPGGWPVLGNSVELIGPLESK